MFSLVGGAYAVHCQLFTGFFGITGFPKEQHKCLIVSALASTNFRRLRGFPARARFGADFVAVEPFLPGSSTFLADFVAGLPFLPGSSTFSAVFVARELLFPVPSTFSAVFVAGKLLLEHGSVRDVISALDEDKN